MRYRLDMDEPTVECCGQTYQLSEQFDSCLKCGEVIDWNDILEAWNTEDWAHLLDESEFRALGIDLEYHGVDMKGMFGDCSCWDDDAVDDDDIPEWAFLDKAGTQPDLFEYAKRSLDRYENYEPLFETGPRPAKPPTGHLPQHHREMDRRDPFFDIDIPDDVL